MFSVVLFISGGVIIKSDLDRVEAISIFMNARDRLKQEGKGCISLRYNDRPLIMFSGKSNKITKLES